jgi:hypothetical protein
VTTTAISTMPMTGDPAPQPPCTSAAAAASAGPTAAPAYLRRLRWAVRGTLTLGVAASVAANILHANPNPISQIIAAWPPLALLLTVELISRVPTHRRSLAIIRLATTAAIAGIAAWVSYWHMVGVAARYGETEAAAAYLLPLSVDGLVIVASVSLVEITGRLRADPEHRSAAPTFTYAAQPTVAEARLAGPTSAPAPDPLLDRKQPSAVVPPDDQPSANEHSPRGTTCATIGDSNNRPVRGASIEASALDLAVPVRPAARSASASSLTAASAPTETDDAAHADMPNHDCDYARARPVPTAIDNGAAPDRSPSSAWSRRRRDQGARRTEDDAHRSASGTDVVGEKDTAPSDTAAAVAYWYRHDPHLHPAEIAARISRSERTVRRYWPPTMTTRAHGHTSHDLTDNLDQRTA